MELKEKLELLEEIMDCEGELTEDTILADVDEWDSLSALSLTVLVRKEFGISLTTDMIRGFVTVKDICDIMQ
ncbi:MAG: acyl carrier protein [Lachnospiraceae bacterium]|nr:acyl carrier protein [Lachnospiraceae bacterium]